MTNVVVVEDGKLRGSIKRDINGEEFYSFQGIPYARPPLGALRFKAPQPPEKWKNVLDATQEKDECYAKNMGAYIGSEDCLYLNVFTKKMSRGKLKPVMFWIHGGGFITGSSKAEIYGPEYLITQDIVLVTFNYRLGALGFLCLEDHSLGVPGNAGLKDMVMALKWVQNYIKQFSGDPNNVTIFGESAGGSAVHMLMLSPMGKGLFHKAVAQSGTALHSWAGGKRHGVHQLAEILGIETNNQKVILDHLQDLSVEELFKGVEQIVDVIYLGHVRPFCPVIERPHEDAFLCEDPASIIKSGRYQKVPLIMGYCSREGMFIYALCKMAKKSQLLRDETIVPFSMNFRKGTDVYKSVSKRVKEYYFHNKEPNTDDIYRLYTDNYFLLPIYNTAKLHLENGHTPIYFYRFSLDTELNFMKSLFSIKGPGACHADDFPYLFKNSFTPDLEPNGAADMGIRRMVKLWTNFAKYGTPTPSKKDPLLPITWTPLTSRKFNTLDIGEKLEMKTDLEKETMDFWNQFFKLKYINSKL